MTQLGRDLQAISVEVGRMLTLVRQSCELARRALVEQEAAAAALCSAADEEIDEMLATSARAFEEGDVAEARRAHALDNEIDDLYDPIQRELLTYMLADTGTIGRATDLFAVARYSERLGDHIENVNEHIVFWLEGVRM